MGCKHLGCDRKHFAKGYCQTHYLQIRAGKETTDIIPRKQVSGSPDTCLADPNCNRKVKRRGLCLHHYRLEMYGACQCGAPRDSDSGLCSKCKARGGNLPKAYIGRGINNDTVRYCWVCESVKENSEFRLNQYSCKACQGERKMLSYYKLREGIFDWMRQHVVQTSNGQCCKCNGQLANWHIDHIVPFSLGGMFEIYNLQILCPQCNIAKGNREITDYRLWIDGTDIENDQGIHRLLARYAKYTADRAGQANSGA